MYISLKKFYLLPLLIVFKITIRGFFPIKNLTLPGMPDVQLKLDKFVQKKKSFQI